MGAEVKNDDVNVSIGDRVRFVGTTHKGEVMARDATTTRVLWDVGGVDYGKDGAFIPGRLGSYSQRGVNAQIVRVP